MSNSRKPILARWAVVVTLVSAIGTALVAAGFWYGHLFKDSSPNVSSLNQTVIGSENTTVGFEAPTEKSAPVVIDQDVSGTGNITIGSGNLNESPD